MCKCKSCICLSCHTQLFPQLSKYDAVIDLCTNCNNLNIWERASVSSFVYKHVRVLNLFVHLDVAIIICMEKGRKLTTCISTSLICHQECLPIFKDYLYTQIKQCETDTIRQLSSLFQTNHTSYSKYFGILSLAQANICSDVDSWGTDRVHSIAGIVHNARSGGIQTFMAVNSPPTEARFFQPDVTYSMFKNAVGSMSPKMEEIVPMTVYIARCEATLSKELHFFIKNTSAVWQKLVHVSLYYVCWGVFTLYDNVFKLLVFPIPKTMFIWEILPLIAQSFSKLYRNHLPGNVNHVSKYGVTAEEIIFASNQVSNRGTFDDEKFYKYLTYTTEAMEMWKTTVYHPSLQIYFEENCPFLRKDKKENQNKRSRV